MKNEQFLYLLLVIMTILGSLGSVFFKSFTEKKQFYLLFFGFFLYGGGALLNIYLLRRLPYTLVVPANSLTFLWTIILAKVFFKETIGIMKISGFIFIISGLFLLVN
ncbi:EamA family transporter [Paenibacillus sp. FSL R7-0204]|uniref:EamA family transporter n=1 Tax=Paenibacillus sp. FSL R7-0204 TaxID=2921675 RepID=UPI0030FA93B8